jgi:hypothetical protein
MLALLQRLVARAAAPLADAQVLDVLGRAREAIRVHDAPEPADGLAADEDLLLGGVEGHVAGPHPLTKTLTGEVQVPKSRKVEVAVEVHDEVVHVAAHQTANDGWQAAQEDRQQVDRDGATGHEACVGLHGR